MKYKVGDKVLIKQWDDMAKEYKLDSVGDICTESGWYFFHSMKHLCGKLVIIEQIVGSDFNYAYRIGSGKDAYYITDDTIERKVNEMTKADLKDGMVCKLRNGEVYIVLGNILTNIEDFLYVPNYIHDLTHSYNNEYDIMGVYTTCGKTICSMLNVENMKEIIWKRDETKEMTVAEIEKLLGYPVKIVKE